MNSLREHDYYTRFSADVIARIGRLLAMQRKARASIHRLRNEHISHAMASVVK
jgi:hypothetical protein